MNDADLGDRLRRSLVVVAEHTEVPDVPSLPEHMPAPRRRAPRRRTVLVAFAATMLPVTAGLGVAAAQGRLPQPLVDVLARDKDHFPAIEPESATQVGELPGPAGHVLQVWAATDDTTGRCLTAVIVAGHPITRPTDVAPLLATCVPGFHTVFGDGIAASTDPGTGVAAFMVDSGDAATARLQLPDGSSAPVAVTDGYAFGWFRESPGAAAPVLVGYDSAGEVMGQTAVHVHPPADGE